MYPSFYFVTTLIPVSLITVVLGLSGRCRRETQIRGEGSTCVDVPSQDNVDGKNLQIWGCQEFGNRYQSKAQVFSLRVNGEFVVMGKCLDVEGPSKEDGAKAQIWSCVNVPQQKFEITVGGEIYNRWADKCLTADGTSWRSSLSFRKCDGRPSQRWAFPQIPPKTKKCNGVWVKTVTYQMSPCGLIISSTPTKKAIIARASGWSNLKNCKPACFELWTFNAGKKTWRNRDPKSPAIESVYNQAVCHARCDLLLPGDRGTGQTWDLESWHQLGPVPASPFLPGADALFCLKTKCFGKSLRSECPKESS